MDKNLTFQTLIAFAYNETKILETIHVVDAIDNDEETSADFKAILATKDLLDNSTLEPAQGILNKIFLYSQQKTLVQSLA